MRIVMKDIIDMDGVCNSAGNRAYGELYGTRDQNALCVERLLDAGAVIVGRTKTAQLACGQFAQDWIDFQSPFNPRADGYQQSGASSAGSASAIASKCEEYYLLRASNDVS